MIPLSRPDDLVWCPEGPSQTAFLCAADDEIVASSPIGQGKTTLLAMKALIHGEEFPGSYNVLVRKLQVYARDQLVPAFRRVVGDDAFLQGWTEQKLRWIDPESRSEFRFGGIDNPGTWWGREIGFCGVDEVVRPLGAPLAEDVEEEEWLAVAKRLRDRKSKVHQLVGVTNPGPRSHWILRRAEDGDLRLIFFKERAGDRWLARDYLERINRMTGVNYARYVLGLWQDAEGLVYVPPWDPRAHLAANIPPPAGHAVEVWVDYGLRHEFCALLTWRGHDRQWRIFAEVYGAGKTTAQWAPEIDRILDELAIGCPIVRCVHDHDPERTINLRAASKRLKTARQFIPADKSIDAGVDSVLDVLSPMPDGRPGLIVDPNRCPNFVHEIESYPWDPRKDRPAKTERVKDHAMDALRMGIHTTVVPVDDDRKTAIVNPRVLRGRGSWSGGGTSWPQ